MADKPAKDWTDQDIDAEAQRRKATGATATEDAIKRYLKHKRTLAQAKDKAANVRPV